MTKARYMYAMWGANPHPQQNNMEDNKPSLTQQQWEGIRRLYREIGAPPRIPESTNFSEFEVKNGLSDMDESEYFNGEDPNIEKAAQEENFLFMLRSLPKDRYRVIALLLYLRNEMDFEYTYDDIASLWGCSKVNVFHHIRRMQGILTKAGLFSERNG